MYCLPFSDLYIVNCLVSSLVDSLANSLVNPLVDSMVSCLVDSTVSCLVASFVNSFKVDSLVDSLPLIVDPRPILLPLLQPRTRNTKIPLWVILKVENEQNTLLPLLQCSSKFSKNAHMIDTAWPFEWSTEKRLEISRRTRIGNVGPAPAWNLKLEDNKYSKSGWFSMSRLLYQLLGALLLGKPLSKRSAVQMEFCQIAFQPPHPQANGRFVGTFFAENR